MEGKLVVLEGPDGTGKTTQAKLLAEFLESKGFKVHMTKEPTNNSVGRAVRRNVRIETKIDDPLLDALLFTADRRSHLIEEIEPKLNEGFIVICDRYYHSTLAYQHTQGLDLDWLVGLNSFARRPDITLIFDLDSELLYKRLFSSFSRIMKDKSKDHWMHKFETREFLKRVRENYKKLQKRLSNENIFFIDASAKPPSIHKEVRKIVSKNLKI